MGGTIAGWVWVTHAGGAQFPSHLPWDGLAPSRSALVGELDGTIGLEILTSVGSNPHVYSPYPRPGHRPPLVYCRVYFLQFGGVLDASPHARFRENWCPPSRSSPPQRGPGGIVGVSRLCAGKLYCHVLTLLVLDRGRQRLVTGSLGIRSLFGLCPPTST